MHFLPLVIFVLVPQLVRGMNIPRTSTVPTRTLKSVVVRQNAPPVTTLTGPSNGHERGDVIITISEKDNNDIAQLIDQYVCPDSKRRKRFVQDCIFDISTSMYKKMEQGQLESLMNIARDEIALPMPPEWGDLTLGQMNLLGQPLQNLPGTDGARRNRLSRVVWWTLYPPLVMHTDDNMPVRVIPALLAQRTDSAPPEETSARCHLPLSIPYCANCGGATTSEGTTCVGFGDLWKLCPCVKNTPLPPELHTMQMSSEQMSAWKLARQAASKKPNISCRTNSNVTQTMGLWDRLADKFCSENDLSDGTLRWMVERDEIYDIWPHYTYFLDYRYYFQWTSKYTPNCQIPPCKAMMNDLHSCGDDMRNRMAVAGTTENSCGTMSYGIEEKLGDVSPKEEYTLDIAIQVNSLMFFTGIMYTVTDSNGLPVATYSQADFPIQDLKPVYMDGLPHSIKLMPRIIESTPYRLPTGERYWGGVWLQVDMDYGEELIGHPDNKDHCAYSWNTKENSRSCLEKPEKNFSCEHSNTFPRWSGGPAADESSIQSMFWRCTITGYSGIV
ncbi:hypothetical protein DPSP01_001809 [Paraphaeosphaeria sporulosa]